MATDLKGRKNLFIIAAIAFVVVIILIIAFFPKGEQDEQGAQEITKRVKLNLIEETVNVGEDHLNQEEADPGHTGEPVGEPAGEPVMAEPEKTEPVMAEPEKAAATPAPVPEPVKMAPAPVKEAPVREAVVKKAPVKKVAPAPKRTQTASVSKGTLAARKPWAINVASFPNSEGARMLEKSLEADGYNAYITSFPKDGISWSRVRVGFYGSKEEAQRSGDSIKRQYKVQSPWIVMPTREETAKYIK